MEQSSMNSCWVHVQRGDAVEALTSCVGCGGGPQHAVASAPSVLRARNAKQLPALILGETR